MMERIVKFRPAYDKRDEGCGIHGAEIVFALKGKDGVVDVELFTNWQLKRVREEMDSALDPMSGYLTYHSPIPSESYSRRSDCCEWLDGDPCYYGQTATGAEPFLDALIEGGDEAVWEKLEEYYREVFGGAE